MDPLRAAVSEHARLPYVSGLTVEHSALGPLAGLVGAAALVAGPAYWSAD